MALCALAPAGLSAVFLFFVVRSKGPVRCEHCARIDAIPAGESEYADPT